MRLSIRLFAGLRERAGSECLELVDVPAGLDIAGLKALLAERHPELGSLEGVRGVIGTTWVTDDTSVGEDDELSLLPPVSGGSAEAEVEALSAGVFEVHAEPLDPQAVQSRLVHPSCGAVVLFTGTTRATNRGFEVERLDYEAFAEMAASEMRRIFDDCRTRFGPPSGPPESAAERRLLMLAQHRTGTVGVAEPSVVIGVASPHRDAAFQACRFLIDELKRHVPLWKKEVYADGHHWVGERS